MKKIDLYNITIIAMKKYFIYISLLVSSICLHAQEETSLEKESKNEDKVVKVELVKNNSFEDTEADWKHKMRVNLFSLIAFKTIDISYERILDPGNSIGVSMLIKTNDEDEVNQIFSITPFYRMYFLNRKDYESRGLFLVLFIPITSIEAVPGESNSFEDYDSEITESFIAIGLGASLEKK